MSMPWLLLSTSAVGQRSHDDRNGSAYARRHERRSRTVDDVRLASRQKHDRDRRLRHHDGTAQRHQERLGGVGHRRSIGCLRGGGVVARGGVS